MASGSNRHLSRLRRIARSPLLAPVHRFYRRERVRHQIREYDPRVVQHRYGGYELSVSLEDPLAEGWYDHDWPLLPELEALQASRLKPGARVFDLGAHQGIVAMMLARIVGDDGEVVGVEADRHNYEVAVRNVALNHVGNAQMVHAAVAAREGSVQFVEGLNGRVLQHGTVGTARVPSVTVDGLAADYGRPDVVFIDVEGYEMEALRGASGCIESGAVDFFIEVHVGHGLEELGGSSADVVRYFPEGGFARAFSVGDAELTGYEFAELDEARLPKERFFLIATTLAKPGTQ